MKITIIKIMIFIIVFVFLIIIFIKGYKSCDLQATKLTKGYEPPDKLDCILNLSWYWRIPVFILLSIFAILFYKLIKK